MLKVRLLMRSSTLFFLKALSQNVTHERYNRRREPL